MKFPRRKFLHLAAGAAALPAVSRIARAQAASCAGALCPKFPPKRVTVTRASVSASQSKTAYLKTTVRLCLALRANGRRPPWVSEIHRGAPTE
jgi:hypothetical protein